MEHIIDGVVQPKPEWKIIAETESFSQYGHTGARIEFMSDHTLSQDERYEVSRLMEKAQEILFRSIGRADPRQAEQTGRERRDLIGLFQEPIYVEEIPNGYCSEYCCEHLPWFIVTTRIGRIKLGWRKRVILIDWSETENRESAMDLFPNEDVTRANQSIHAWSLEKARDYIGRIIAVETLLNRA